MSKNGLLSRHKRRRFMMFPGDLSRLTKIAMLEKGECAYPDLLPNAAKIFKNDFAHHANRRLRHERIGSED